VPVFKDGSRRSSLTTESKGNSKAGCPIHRALCDEWDSTAASFQGSRPGFASRATNLVVILSGAKDLKNHHSEAKQNLITKSKMGKTAANAARNTLVLKNLAISHLKPKI
jgi:hypothetical protein